MQRRNGVNFAKTGCLVSCLVSCSETKRCTMRSAPQERRKPQISNRGSIPDRVKRCMPLPKRPDRRCGPPVHLCSGQIGRRVRQIAHHDWKYNCSPPYCFMTCSASSWALHVKKRSRADVCLLKSGSRFISWPCINLRMWSPSGFLYKLMPHSPSYSKAKLSHYRPE